MAEYIVTTDKGKFKVTTEDPVSPIPLSKPSALQSLAQDIIPGSIRGLKEMKDIGLGLMQLPNTALQSTLGVGKTLLKTATGEQSKEELGRQIVQGAKDTALGMTETIRHPVKSFKERPISTTMELLPYAKGVTSMVGKTIAPFAKSVDIPLVKLAGETGVELPASSLSKSYAPMALESLATKGLFGRKMAEQVEKAGIQISKYADDTVRNISKITDDNVAGTKLLQSFDNMKMKFLDTKNKLYDNFSESAGKLDPASTLPNTKTYGNVTKNTKDILKDIVQNKKSTYGEGSTDVSFFNRMLKDIENPGKQTFNSLKNTRTEIGTRLKAKTDPITAKNEADLKRVYGSLSDDMDSLILNTRPDLKPVIDRANNYYKAGLGRLNTEWGKYIEKNRNNPSVLTNILTDKNLPIEDVPRIYRLLGRENKPIIQANFIENMFAKAKNQDGIISAPKLTQMINSYGDTKINAILNPEQIQSLKNVQKLSQAWKKGQFVSMGSQTAFVGKLASEFALLGTNPQVGIPLIIGDYAFSKLIASPAGQRLLTTGYKIPQIPTSTVIPGIVQSGIRTSEKKSPIPMR